jgi:hypothetical protein
MGQIVAFPSPTDRDWRVWEDSVRTSTKGTVFDTEVVEAALPAIKQHWQAIFESVTLEPPMRPIPGPLSKEKAKAIQQIIDTGAQVVVDRLKQERHTALGRRVQAELTLSLFRLRGAAS